MSVQITMPVSNHTIRINRLRYEMMLQTRHVAEQELADKKPIPPKQKITIASGEEQEVENATHPDYIKNLEMWNTGVATLASVKLAELMAMVGIADDPPDDIHQTMEQYKRAGLPVNENPKIFWMLMIVAPADDDFKFLMFELFGRSMPQERQVAFWREMFRHHIPGKVNLELPNT